MMSTGGFARTPKPPYYAVIFTSVRTPGDRGYAETSDRMVELSSARPGFLGMESVRTDDGAGITVCYWESAEAIAAWKAQVEHQLAQRRGQQDWYEHYEVRVARVERAYGKRAT
jgi:heme-degrading monooxygenase HmoA